MSPTVGDQREMNVIVSFPGRQQPMQRRRQARVRAGLRSGRGFLPIPTSSLVGRERDVASVEACLRIEGPAAIRLLNLVGSPGSGKTRLAIAAAERLVDSFEHGVYFIDLSTLRDAAAVPASIAHALGATYTGHRPMPIEDTLKRALRDRRVLLVLDNFEGVLGSGALVEDLLAACSGLRALVTSREPLRTPSEHQFEVAPLAIPNLLALPAAESLGQVAAVQLFVDRVRPIRPGWQVTSANAAAVAEICVRLDGLPLAIELAASWMNVLTPQAMLAELPHSMNLLDGRGAGHGRHETLDATIGWSYDLLSDAEQRLFRRLAVFEGGWTVDTCVSVCGDEGSERAEMLKLLRALLEKHLVTRSEDEDGRVRFGFLETIREYASRRLADNGELPRIRRRHAVVFVDLAERAERELDSAEQAAWIEEFERERGNLRAALGWAITVGEPGAADLGLRLAATLWLFWDVRGHMQEGREPLRELLQLSETRTRTIARGRALLAAGWLGYVKGDVGEVEHVIEEALSIARERGDERALGRGLAILGTTLAAYTSDFDRTGAVLDEALKISRPLGDTWGIGFALYNQGVLAMRSGRLDEASIYLQQCRQISASSGNTFGIGCSVFRLGWIAGARGDHARALELLNEALRLHWALRNRRVVALCLEQLACLGSGLGEAQVRVRLFAAAEAMFERLPDYTLPPQMVEAHQRGLAAAKQTLGDRAFREAWTAGQRLSVEEAVNLALGANVTEPLAFERSGLTAREVQILGLVAQDLTNREIGLRLGLSHHTVGNHLRRIFGKAGVSSRTGLVIWSVRSGFIAADGPAVVLA